MFEIKGSRIMILGAYGQVGKFVAKALLPFSPGTLFVSSLREQESRECARELGKEKSAKTKIEPLWGNIYFPSRLKDKPIREIIESKRDLRELLSFTYSELDEAIIKSSTLFEQVSKAKPDIIIDCVNTAQALAYGDIYSIFDELTQKSPSDLLSKTLLIFGLPQLVRHIQILYESLRRNGVRMYIKVGTTGTGGMGLNLPFTHGEPTPSRLLMLKSAFAGAHSMLLYALSKTPDSPAIKEVKPATLIAWKDYGKGKIEKFGNPIPIYDLEASVTYKLVSGSLFDLKEFPRKRTSGRFLEGTFIDTGENGVFSLSEFKVITSLGLMEFVTPNEIANYVVDLIRGHSTSKDFISAIDASSIHSTYRASYLRHSLIEKLEKRKEEGITYGFLGPRLSKLLLEAYLLKFSFGDYRSFLERTPEESSSILQDFVLRPGNPITTSSLSLGIPILLPSGSDLLFARRDSEEKTWERRPWRVSKENIERFAHSEWVDLRPKNIKTWQKRIKDMKSRDPSFDPKAPIDPACMVAFVLKYEFKGGRREIYDLSGFPEVT